MNILSRLACLAILAGVTGCTAQANSPADNGPWIKSARLPPALFGYAAAENRSLAAIAHSPGYMAVYRAAIAHEVAPALALSIAKAESRGNCGVTSRAGAQGVMQVMPRTARAHGIRRGLKNCKTGAEAGVKELKRLLIKYKGNKRLVLISYNCGEGCIRRSRLPKETTRYLKKHRGVNAYSSN